MARMFHHPPPLPQALQHRPRRSSPWRHAGPRVASAIATAHRLPRRDRANPLAARPPPCFAPKAKRVIYLHMSGGPPQLDLFDYKPELVKHNMQPCPDELLKDQRFAFIKGIPSCSARRTSSRSTARAAPGSASCCRTSPSVVDDIALIRSMHTDQFNHAAGGAASLHRLAAQRAARRWARGSPTAWARENQDLPGFVVLICGGTDPTGGKGLWSSGFLPRSTRACSAGSMGDPILYVSDPKGMDRDDRRRSLDALGPQRV